MWISSFPSTCCWKYFSLLNGLGLFVENHFCLSTFNLFYQVLFLKKNITVRTTFLNCKLAVGLAPISSHLVVWSTGDSASLIYETRSQWLSQRDVVRSSGDKRHEHPLRCLAQERFPTKGGSFLIYYQSGKIRNICCVLACKTSHSLVTIFLWKLISPAPTKATSTDSFT